MADEQNPDAGTINGPTPTEPAEGVSPTTHQEPEGQDANAEAAKWRRALRAEQAESAALRERLDAAHRAQIETAAADVFHDPTDLWSATTLDDMRGDDGLIDPEKAEQAMQTVLEQKPHWGKLILPTVHQGARESHEPPAPSFGDQLQRAVRR
jgi:hypothetical protein